jgi:dTDP-4-dehydrorhamnose reductase
MYILILGGTGMLGHKLFQHLRQRHPDTYCTVRGSIHDPALRSVKLFQTGHIIENCELTDFRALQRLLSGYRPQILVNCAGIVKQRADAKRAVPSILLNALLPHQLSELSAKWGGKLIHFSTDCVFSGKRGNYDEEDLPDAGDLYGRTKALGEVTTGSAITLRTSIIGRELVHSESLLEWFLKQNHSCVFGYTRAMYSGVTTNYMAKVVANLIEGYPNLSGLYQVTSQTISKCELLCLIRDAYKLDIEITPDTDFFCDRSMKGDRFAKATGRICPPWPELVAELANDDTPYEEWKHFEDQVL